MIYDAGLMVGSFFDYLTERTDADLKEHFVVFSPTGEIMVDRETAYGNGIEVNILARKSGEFVAFNSGYLSYGDNLNGFLFSGEDWHIIRTTTEQVNYDVFCAPNLSLIFSLENSWVSIDKLATTTPIQSGLQIVKAAVANDRSILAVQLGGEIHMSTNDGLSFADLAVMVYTSDQFLVAIQNSQRLAIFGGVNTQQPITVVLRVYNGTVWHNAGNIPGTIIDMAWGDDDTLFVLVQNGTTVLVHRYIVSDQSLTTIYSVTETPSMFGHKLSVINDLIFVPRYASMPVIDYNGTLLNTLTFTNYTSLTGGKVYHNFL